MKRLALNGTVIEWNVTDPPGLISVAWTKGSGQSSRILFRHHDDCRVDSTLRTMSEPTKPFRDDVTGLHFQFIQNPPPSPVEAAAKFAKWQVSEKGTLFEMWKARKMNRRWQGDKTAKQEAIFQETHAKSQDASRPITIFEV